MSDLIFPASSLPALRLVSRNILTRTTVSEGDTGAEYRVGRWAAARYSYTYELHCRDSLSERATLEGWFLDHGGARDSFLLADPVDGVTRRVRFADDDLPLERVAGGVYLTQFELVTVIDRSVTYIVDEGGSYVVPD